MGLYVMPKLIELIKDPAVDSRTNSTPFVIGETVTGLRSGVRLRVVAPNDVYKFNPYTDEELPSSYASTTAFLNIDLDSLAAQATGAFFGNMEVGEILVGASGAKAVVKDRRLLSDRSGKMHGSLYIPPARRLFPRDVVTILPFPGVGESGVPRFRTGSNTLRFTTDAKDSRLAGAVASSAEAEMKQRAL